MTEIYVGTDELTTLIRVVNRGTWEGSLGLLERCRQCLEGTCRRIVVDLSDCRYVDSTFCGMLVELAFAIHDRSGCEIRLYGVRGVVRDTMTELGLVRFFPFVSEEPAPDDVAVEPLPLRPKTRLEQADHVVHAHEQLMRASQGNVPRFSDIVKALRAEADAARSKEPGK
jgi:anti-anti-sigma factor